MIVDVHAHLDHPLIYKDIDKIINRAKKAGVKVVVTNGVDYSTNLKALEIANKYDLVKPALGIYPPDALKTEIKDGGYPEKLDLDVEKNLKFIEDKKDEIIAVGEVGLDYFNGKDKEAQKEIFSKVIKLAEKLGKPMLVHSRKAEQDVIDILEENNAKKVVLHCFSGKKKLVKYAAKLGYSFSIPANIVRSQGFQMIIEEVSLSQILTETDAPWLSPFKDKFNEPAFITESIKKISEIKQMNLQEVEKIIYMNYLKLFL